MLSTAKLNATRCRWVPELANFHITIKYRSGKENTGADTLSKIPVPIETLMEECTEELSSRSVQATVQSVEEQGIILWPMKLSAHCTAISISAHQPIPPEEIRLAQREDLFIGPVVEYMISGIKPTIQQLKSCSMQSK